MSAIRAMMTGPAYIGSMVKRAPRAFSALTAAAMSATGNVVQGTPCAYSAAWYSRAAGSAAGSSSSSTPSTPAGEPTVRRQPPVLAIERHVLDDAEAEHLGVPHLCLVLVIDGDAGVLDADTWRFSIQAAHVASPRGAAARAGDGRVKLSREVWHFQVRGSSKTGADSVDGSLLLGQAGPALCKELI